MARQMIPSINNTANTQTGSFLPLILLAQRSAADPPLDDNREKKKQSRVSTPLQSAEKRQKT